LFEIKKGKIEEYELHRTLTISNSFTLVWDVIWFLLDSLSKFRKATNSSAMPICLSVCLYVTKKQLSSHWTDFHETSNFNIFKNPDTIKVLLKSDKKSYMQLW
jgi:hypothetical protein